MKRFLTAIAVLLAACATVFAQGGYQVKGVVVDAIGPVIGASVIEQGTSNGVSTGLDGDFTLTVSSANATIEVSCIGYATQTFAASAVPATIVLAEDTNFLDEVVVIGYGTVKKTDMTGSVVAVKNDEINRGAITSPAQAMMGKVSGMLVTPASGSPGEGATIRIRGAASLNANNDPLIVIDVYVYDKPYYREMIKLEGSDALPNLTEVDLDVQEGAYIVIDECDMIFTPYQGKPKLGF